MKKIMWILVCLLMFVIEANAAGFQVESPQLEPGKEMEIAQVLNGFGCSGENISPELHWTGAPKGTKSFAITVYDPDAPTGSGWWHWTVFNIPQSVSLISADASKKGAMPEGAIEGRTDFGSQGYGGACPPEGHGPHAYHFRVWALDVEQLPLDEQAAGAMLGFFLNQHKLAVAEIVVTWER